MSTVKASLGSSEVSEVLRSKGPLILGVSLLVAVALPIALLAFVQWTERRRRGGAPTTSSLFSGGGGGSKKPEAAKESYWDEVARLEEKTRKDREEREMSTTAVKDNVIFDSANGMRTAADVMDLGGETERYKWGQSDKEVTVSVPVPEGVRAKDIVCTVTTTRLLLTFPGDDTPVFDGELYSKVLATDSIWDIEEEGGGRSLSLVMPKMEKTRGNQHWPCVVRGHQAIDTKRFGPPVVAIGPGMDNNVDVGKITGKT